MLVTMARSICPACDTRRARRACPALGQQICPVCCGTKRLVEIRCPSDCNYLRSANAHPPAVVQRQQERDYGFLLPLFGGLTERQQQIALVLQATLRASEADAPPLTDGDVEQAAKATAETFETASRGIVYEHRATSLGAQRLAGLLQALIEEQRKEGARLPDEDVAAAARCIETAAREAGRVLEGGGRAYLALVERLLRSAEKGSSETDPPRIVAP